MQKSLNNLLIIKGFFCDPGAIQTHDLQNRNLTLYSAKLRDPLFCRPFLRLYDIETEVDCKITAFI